MENMNAPQNSSIYQPESGQNETPFAQAIVQLSKQEYIQLKWDSRYWRRHHDRALAREVVLKQENEHLQAQIRDLKQRLYGKRTRRLSPNRRPKRTQANRRVPVDKRPTAKAMAVLCAHTCRSLKNGMPCHPTRHAVHNAPNFMSALQRQKTPTSLK